MGVVNVSLMPDGRLVRERDGVVVETLLPRVDRKRLDATTEVEIAAQEAEDEAEATEAAGAYARRVRRRTGLTQAAFAARIGVPFDTVRDLEQGKHAPTGPGAGARSRPLAGSGVGGAGVTAMGLHLVDSLTCPRHSVDGICNISLLI